MVRVVTIAFFLVLSCDNRFNDEIMSHKKMEELITDAKQANDVEIAIEKLLEANRLNNELPDDTIKSAYYRRIACEYYNHGLLEPYYEQTRQNILFAKKINDTLLMSKLYFDLGDYYLDKNVNDSSYFYYNKAIKSISIETNEKLRSKLNIAKLLLYENQLIESEVQLIKAISIAKKNNDNRILYECYSFLGGVQSGLNNYDEALKSYEFSKKYLENLKKDEQYEILISENYNNIANVFLKMNDYIKAIEFYQKGLNILKTKKKNPKLFAILVDNLNYAAFKNQTLDNPNGFFEALKIRDSLGHTLGIIMSNQRIGEYFLKTYDSLSSNKHLNIAHQLAKESRSFRDQLAILKLKSLSNPSKAKIFQEEYIKISDSLLVEERLTRNKFAKIEFETDQIQQEKLVLTQKMNLLLISSGIAMLLLGSLYFIYRQKVKYKVLLLEKEQQKSNEEVYNLLLTQQQQIDHAKSFEKKRIATELHDGVISQLFGIRIHLERLIFLDNEFDRLKIENYLSKLNKLEHEIRGISHKLSEDETDKNQGFILLIKNYLNEFEDDFQVKVILENDPNIKWDSLKNDCKINLFRIIQEALTNIIKYAKADQVVITFKSNENRLEFTISDNGIGFNPENTKEGIGLKNMRFRIRNINGTLDLKSSNKGTLISGGFPLSSE